MSTTYKDRQKEAIIYLENLSHNVSHFDIEVAAMIFQICEAPLFEYFWNGSPKIISSHEALELMK